MQNNVKQCKPKNNVEQCKTCNLTQSKTHKKVFEHGGLRKGYRTMKEIPGQIPLSHHADDLKSVKCEATAMFQKVVLQRLDNH